MSMPHSNPEGGPNFGPDIQRLPQAESVIFELGPTLLDDISTSEVPGGRFAIFQTTVDGKETGLRCYVAPIVLVGPNSIVSNPHLISHNEIAQLIRTQVVHEQGPGATINMVLAGYLKLNQGEPTGPTELEVFEITYPRNLKPALELLSNNTGLRALLTAPPPDFSDWF